VMVFFLPASMTQHRWSSNCRALEALHADIEATLSRTGMPCSLGSDLADALALDRGHGLVVADSSGRLLEMNRCAVALAGRYFQGQGVVDALQQVVLGFGTPPANRKRVIIHASGTAMLEIFAHPLGNSGRPRSDLLLSLEEYQYTPKASYQELCAALGRAGCTAAEIDVAARLILTDYPTKEIARRLNRSLGTVRVQERSVYRKLGVGSRVSLIHRFL
jgi:DNA-binding CsgD family transcriptional regulator